VRAFEFRFTEGREPPLLLIGSRILVNENTFGHSVQQTGECRRLREFAYARPALDQIV
jgi:hypothetical protein